MLVKLMWLSIAGACGTVSRFAVYELAAKTKVTHLPIGTFTVNILGSFLFGFIYAAAESKLNMSAETRVILLAGFMGAFTTFSTFAFETAKMLNQSQWMLAFGNIFGQTALGILAMGIGVVVGRMM